MDGIGILTAFGAGILSFLSPCVLPLIPAYICFITGSSLEELAAPSGKTIKAVLPSAVVFVLGFSAVFIFLGASATLFGSFLFSEKSVLKIIGGIIVIIFGMHISGLFKIKYLQFEKKFHIQEKPINILGAFFVGMAFGFGWTPCIGPILGSILLLAATKETVYNGIVLLSMYSLGLAIPFLVVALCVGKALKVFSTVKRHFRKISIASGVLLILMGLWIIFG